MGENGTKAPDYAKAEGCYALAALNTSYTNSRIALWISEQWLHLQANKSVHQTFNKTCNKLWLSAHRTGAVIMSQRSKQLSGVDLANYRPYKWLLHRIKQLFAGFQPSRCDIIIFWLILANKRCLRNPTKITDLSSHLHFGKRAYILDMFKHFLSVQYLWITFYVKIDYAHIKHKSVNLQNLEWSATDYIKDTHF